MSLTTHSKTSKYIVYADDDIDDRELFLEFIKESADDLTPVFFSDGLSLFQYLEALPADGNFPSCIILDLNMPIWDGLRTLKTIRRIPRYDKIPIIIFSTTSNSKDQGIALQSGANGFLEKPTSLADSRKLIALLAKFISHDTA